MFDAFRSVVPAPDHLFFNGLTVGVLRGCFRALSPSDRALVSCSLREALALSGMRRTRPYNVKSGRLNSLGMSEWSAVLSVGRLCFRRALSREVVEVRRRETPFQVMLRILDMSTLLVCATYYTPRVDLDGGDACRGAPSAQSLQRDASAFMSFVDVSMRRRDCVPFLSSLDKPNLHRLREMFFFVVPHFLHVRHVRELFFESAHQPLKHAALSGNGHDDARRAMDRMLETECFSRIASAPEKFNVPSHYFDHPGIAKQLKESAGLWTRAGKDWRVAGDALAESLVPASALAVAVHHCPSGYRIPWRTGATRGDAEYLRIGDAVSVLCTGAGVGIRMVSVAMPEHATEPGARTRFYRAVAFYGSVGGRVVALVHPFIQDGANTWQIEASRTLSLTLPRTVRRSLALHACEGDCREVSAASIEHRSGGQWHVLGRASLYPAISG